MVKMKKRGYIKEKEEEMRWNKFLGPFCRNHCNGTNNTKKHSILKKAQMRLGRECFLCCLPVPLVFCKKREY